jgi:hypothetical protein
MYFKIQVTRRIRLLVVVIVNVYNAQCFTCLIPNVTESLKICDTIQISASHQVGYSSLLILIRKLKCSDELTIHHYFIAVTFTTSAAMPSERLVFKSISL